MATITNQVLKLGNVLNNQRSVTVAGVMNFDARDVGKTFKLEIKLFGEDKPGDALSPTDPVGDDLLYTFLWRSPLMPVPFRYFTPGAARNVPFEETRLVDCTKLDEDAGFVPALPAPPPFRPLPRKDEVYAAITLSHAFSTTVKTPTVIAGGIV